MSTKFRFKISISHYYFFVSLALVGVFLAALFIYFSPTALLESFFEKVNGYFSFSGFPDFFILLMQEYFWILLIMALSHFAHSKIYNLSIIIYKGFSIGIVSSLFCWQYGIKGIWYIIVLVFPQSFFYISSLAIALQISFEMIGNNFSESGRHSRTNCVDGRAYLVSFVLTGIAILIEWYAVPYFYQILFK